MDTSIGCQECGRLLRVKSELTGKRIKCPHCGAVQSARHGTDPLQSPQRPAQTAPNEEPDAPVSTVGAKRFMWLLLGGVVGASTLFAVSLWLLFGRNRGVEYTVSNERVRVTASVLAAAEEASQMSDDELREAVSSGRIRAVTFFREGHIEAIWRDRSGHVLFTIGDHRRAFTSRNRQSLQGILQYHTETEIRTWVQDPTATEESRTAKFDGRRIPEGAADPP